MHMESSLPSISDPSDTALFLEAVIENGVGRNTGRGSFSYKRAGKCISEGRLAVIG